MDKHPIESEEESFGAIELAKEKTRSYAKDLWDILQRYSQSENIELSHRESRSSVPKNNFHSRKLLISLSLVPYLLVIMFLISFIWDFDNINWQFFNYSIAAEGLLKILSVSGLIGFLTNWLAITMLFKPVRKRPILGHGLVPAQKDRIAFRLAQTISKDLINPEIIKQKIHESDIISKYREQTSRYLKSIIGDPSFRADLKIWVVNYIDEMIANKEIRAAIAQKMIENIEEALKDKSIEKVALKAYSYIKGQEMQHIIEDALTQLPSSVERGLDKVDDLLDDLPAKIEKHSDAIESTVTNILYKLINRLDVHTLVEDNLKKYDEQRISHIIRGATNEQLNYIQYLGAILGTIGGLVIWQPLISTLALALIVFIVIALDNFLIKLSA